MPPPRARRSPRYVRGVCVYREGRIEGAPRGKLLRPDLAV
jgi:hypothetical protein